MPRIQFGVRHHFYEIIPFLRNDRLQFTFAFFGVSSDHLVKECGDTWKILQSCRSVSTIADDTLNDRETKRRCFKRVNFFGEVEEQSQSSCACGARSHDGCALQFDPFCPYGSLPLWLYALMALCLSGSLPLWLNALMARCTYVSVPSWLC